MLIVRATDLATNIVNVNAMMLKQMKTMKCVLVATAVIT